MKKDYVTPFVLAAEWVHFCIRLNPKVAQVLQVLNTWLKKSQSEMDEEVFVHFVLFFLVHKKFIPSLENAMVSEGKGHIKIPLPSESEFIDFECELPNKIYVLKRYMYT